MANNTEVEAGQRVYTPFTLRLYDWFVLGFSNRFIWRCPTSNLRALYARHVSSRHLDIGVGTGYFLDNVAWPTLDPDIVLLDLNNHSLEASARRISRFAPKKIVANCLEPLPLEERFDSIGLCYLLHCVPGKITEKAVIFDHAALVMNDGATIFGATILQDAPRSKPAQMLMNFYNSKGVFSNASDTLQDLTDILESRFTDVAVSKVGTVALFSARHKK